LVFRAFVSIPFYEMPCDFIFLNSQWYLPGITLKKWKCKKISSIFMIGSALRERGSSRSSHPLAPPPESASFWISLLL
jgi:hypothetical protein